jgi:hypothetical protein
MTDLDYIARRLARIAEDAVTDAQIAVTKITADAAGKGALGNSRVYILYDEAVGKELKKALRAMAFSAFNASGSTAESIAQLVKAAASEFVENVAGWLQKKYKSTAAFGYTGPSVSTLKEQLNEMIDAVVDDFRHGMIGEEKLKPDPVYNVVTNVTGSSHVVIQNAIGENNRQSVEQQSLLAELDKLLASREFKDLGEADRNAVEDMVDALRAEVTKADAKPEKVARWGERLIAVLKQFGLHVAAAGITHLLFAAAGAPGGAIPL